MQAGVDQGRNDGRGHVGQASMGGHVGMSGQNRTGWKLMVVVDAVVNPLVVSPTSQQADDVEFGFVVAEDASNSRQKGSGSGDPGALGSEGETSILDVDVVHPDVGWPHVPGEDIRVVEHFPGLNWQSFLQLGSTVVVVGRAETDGIALAEGQQQDVEDVGVPVFVQQFRLELEMGSVPPSDEKALKFAGTKLGVVDSTTRIGASCKKNAEKFISGIQESDTGKI